jgi:hypothetical protein
LGTHKLTVNVSYNCDWRGNVWHILVPLQNLLCLHTQGSGEKRNSSGVHSLQWTLDTLSGRGTGEAGTHAPPPPRNQYLIHTKMKARNSGGGASGCETTADFQRRAGITQLSGKVFGCVLSTWCACVYLLAQANDLLFLEKLAVLHRRYLLVQLPRHRSLHRHPCRNQTSKMPRRVADHETSFSRPVVGGFHLCTTKSIFMSTSNRRQKMKNRSTQLRTDIHCFVLNVLKNTTLRRLWYKVFPLSSFCLDSRFSRIPPSSRGWGLGVSVD